ncbi:3-oxoacyl-[acyl-carrier-protein] synthase III C-terminal domain-containing protein [Pseudolysinimonas kribbensis]|uniref:Alpha-pyrone synthesis polyketide synthase-like Pks11 n=1 Tax=Pseudolysinimonas kribbensis TaxID=433641 RepID=A0ABQ6K447_9MICO|nr:3-oxoacyl-[acyl-carrier-protein] synthase III C-terminal domain-containing protein [Pseudolysinimonas kribbensis]GMA95114.1 alpha-pyrone synthesis polyketide synthase-like Pks11 [Pseudolysinimonas kribbensis]
MSRIVAVAPALPEYAYTQAEIAAEIGSLITHDAGRLAVLSRFHAASGIGHRHTVLPLERYRDLHGFEEANDLWLSEGTALAARAVVAALDAAGLRPTDVDHLLFTSVTGIGVPSIDARLVSRIGLRPDVKRMPSFGLGCVAGAAGLARVHDYLLGHPDDIAVLLSVELCSLTLQRDDDSTANFVASGLFGDGAAAVVVAGTRRAEALGLPGPDIVDTRSALYPDSESVIGWDIGGTGFRIVLTAAVAQTIDANIAGDVERLLASNALTGRDIGAWIAHPGGPRVLEAFEKGLGLDRADLAPSWRSLDAVGNLSSSSVLHVLADVIRQPDGTNGLLFALGPGVTSEYVLLNWAA